MLVAADVVDAEAPEPVGTVALAADLTTGER